MWGLLGKYEQFEILPRIARFPESYQPRQLRLNNPSQILN